MAKRATKTGKELERRVADAYRAMGAWKVQHDVELAGNQIDVYVELETPGRLLHRIAVDPKDRTRPVGVKIVNDFAQIVGTLRHAHLIDKGIIVSAAGFSKQARDAARTHGIRLLELADLNAMVEEVKKEGGTSPKRGQELTVQVTVPLESSIQEFTPVERESFTFALSRIVNISPDQIRILRVAPGSVQITLEMPEEAARLLVSMYLAEEPVLKTLRIAKIELRQIITPPDVSRRKAETGVYQSAELLRRSMGLKPKKRILVIEDEPNWQKLISELLQEVADELDCAIEVVIASHLAEALNSVVATPYDCATVDNRLQDGKMAHMVLDRIAGLDRKVPVVVVSGSVDPSEVRDFFKEYNIDEFFWKNGFKPRQFKQTLVKLLAPVEPVEMESVATDEDHQRTGDKHVDWNTIIGLAVSAVSPYAVAFATSAATAAGKELVETASEGIKGLWQWIRQTISESNDESAEQVWESFKQNPQSNRDALVGILRHLSPEDDMVLRGYVEGLIQQAQLREDADLFSLLDNANHYTFNDLKRICGRINPHWEGEVGANQTQEGLARWVVNHARTRNLRQDLIAAMLEMNPALMLQ